MLEKLRTYPCSQSTLSRRWPCNWCTRGRINFHGPTLICQQAQEACVWGKTHLKARPSALGKFATQICRRGGGGGGGGAEWPLPRALLSWRHNQIHHHDDKHQTHSQDLRKADGGSFNTLKSRLDFFQKITRLPLKTWTFLDILCDLN